MKPFVRSAAPLVLAGALIVAITACGSPATPTPSQTSPTPTSVPPGQATPTAGPQATPASSFDAAAHFRGRTIVIVDGFSPGGQSDTLARLWARFAPQHFPGNPRFIIRNLPGGGGLRGLQYNMGSTPDGLTAGMVHTRWVKREVAGDDVEGFDPFNAKWLGVPDPAASYSALYARRAVATSWQEVLDSGIVLRHGTTEPGGSQDLAPAFIEMQGGPIRIIYGYGGSAEALAAKDRGEIDTTGFGTENLALRLFPEWAERRFIVPLFWWGEPIPASYLERLGATEPPYVFDLIPVEDWQRDTFEILTDLDRLSSRTFLLPSDTPDDIYQTWLQAWEATVQSPEFIETKVGAGFEPGYTSASEIRQIIERSRQLIDLRPDAQQIVRQLLAIE